MKVWPAPHDAEHEVLLQNPHYIGHPQAPSLTRLQHAHAARASGRTEQIIRSEEKQKT